MSSEGRYQRKRARSPAEGAAGEVLKAISPKPDLLDLRNYAATEVLEKPVLDIAAQVADDLSADEKEPEKKQANGTNEDPKKSSAASSSFSSAPKTDPTMVPIRPKLPTNLKEQMGTRRMIVVLEQACLEVFRTGGKNEQDAKYQLLNCDDHQNVLNKMGKEVARARPDITHMCLLTLLDSPLNKAGLLQIYVHTTRNVLIEVNPQVRIPRTFRRFSGLMVQLLHRLSIRSVNGNEKLLKVIKNPITDHLPPNCRKISKSIIGKRERLMRLALSFDSPVRRVSEYLDTLEEDESICIAVGAMAHGEDNFADGWGR